MAISPNEMYISSISTFLNFVILRWQGATSTPFDTHPKTVAAAVVSFLLLVCSILAGAEARFRSASGALIARAISVFWFLTMASVVSLLLPDSVRAFLYVLCLAPLFPELLRKFKAWLEINRRWTPQLPVRVLSGA